MFTEWVYPLHLRGIGGVWGGKGDFLLCVTLTVCLSLICPSGAAKKIIEPNMNLGPQKNFSTNQLAPTTIFALGLRLGRQKLV